MPRRRCGPTSRRSPGLPTAACGLGPGRARAGPAGGARGGSAGTSGGVSGSSSPATTSVGTSIAAISPIRSKASQACQSASAAFGGRAREQALHLVHGVRRRVGEREPGRHGTPRLDGLARGLEHARVHAQARARGAEDQAPRRARAREDRLDQKRAAVGVPRDERLVEPGGVEPSREPPAHLARVARGRPRRGAAPRQVRRVEVEGAQLARDGPPTSTRSRPRRERARGVALLRGDGRCRRSRSCRW